MDKELMDCLLGDKEMALAIHDIPPLTNYTGKELVEIIN